MVGAFQLKIVGDDLGDYFKRAAKMFADGTKLTEPISTEMVRTAQERIESGIGPNLAKATGRTGNPLQDTGYLKNSIRATHSPDWARATAHHEWAYVHQFGAVIYAKPGTRKVTYINKNGKTVSYEAPNILAWKGKDGIWRFARRVVIPMRPIFVFSAVLKRRIRNAVAFALEELRASTPKINKQVGKT